MAGEAAVERVIARQAALDGAIRVTAAWTRWFLVERRVDLGLAKIEVFDSPTRAADAKIKADARIARHEPKRGNRNKIAPSVCLFGAPDLATLIAHHPDWFDAACARSRGRRAMPADRQSTELEAMVESAQDHLRASRHYATPTTPEIEAVLVAADVPALLERLAKVEAENRDLWGIAHVPSLVRARAALLDEIHRLREALAFYADPKNYEDGVIGEWCRDEPNPITGGGDYEWEPDVGERARSALAENQRLREIVENEQPGGEWFVGVASDGRLDRTWPAAAKGRSGTDAVMGDAARIVRVVSIDRVRPLRDALEKIAALDQGVPPPADDLDSARLNGWQDAAQIARSALGEVSANTDNERSADGGDDE